MILIFIMILGSSCGNDLPCGDAMTKAIEEPDSVRKPAGGMSVTIKIDSTWREHEVNVYLPADLGKEP